MLTPPFKLASAVAVPSSLVAAGAVAHQDCDCPSAADTPPGGRLRLAQMDTHLHCSVLGTCLDTAELRKLVARFIDVDGASDLDVHHDAVKLCALAGPAAKALHKALDHRHAAALQRFAKARDPEAVSALWSQALAQGEIPGAYWAVLTHRELSADLRKKVFGDVHMLSHLVGAANRADIRRLVELEREKAGLRESLERHQERAQALLEERDQTIVQLRSELASARREPAKAEPSDAAEAASPALDPSALASLVALQTARRERAEQASAAAQLELARLLEELDHSRQNALALGRELTALEAELGDGEGRVDAEVPALGLHGKRILYVGGRPSTSAAIRDLVLRRGGEFQRHDGGLEDRKGLLPAAVAWASLVLFPVDCVDHDSVNHLKRLCARQGVAYVPLRSAGAASFIAGLSTATELVAASPICLKHG